MTEGAETFEHLSVHRIGITAEKLDKRMSRRLMEAGTARPVCS